MQVRLLLKGSVRLGTARTPATKLLLHKELPQSLQPSEFVMHCWEYREFFAKSEFNAGPQAANFRASSHDQRKLCGISFLSLRLISATPSEGVSLS